MDMYEARFTQVQISRAAGLDLPQKMRLWFERKQLKFTEHRGAKFPHRYSARMALHVGIMNAAAAQWVPPAIANAAATNFLKVGGTDLETGASRLPGELFEGGGTVLVIPKLGEPKVIQSTIENGRIAIKAMGYAMDGCTLIILNGVYSDVMSRLQAIADNRGRRAATDVSRGVAGG